MPKVRKESAPKIVTRPLSFITEDVDFKVATLANFGWHIKAIALETGLSPSQTYYRIKAAGIKLRDYRDGNNEHARRVLYVQDVIFNPKEVSKMRKDYEANRLAVLAAVKARTTQLRKRK